ncbi:polysulfide reductase NrfD [Adlercreutzia muris]|uniref:NrfD/PsrC family molybdoenzyme membrane anchor subunit n=1 Tax=Adlercreutzia muris TaxID=1796610 RepID=UPI0021D5CFFA|nr:NrfD/PsrC family molybdoenzyme membrane anchor subunit [Adlercreutzia muris]MCU7584266.1 polysulfide reductase NrfD [Adlercreutzia muris]
MLGTFVVVYLFLGGCGAGVLLVTAAWSLLFHCTKTRTFGQSRALWALTGRLYLVSFTLLALSALCLLLDLGKPDRFFLLFLRPTPSLLSMGSFALLAALLVSGCLAAVHELAWPLSSGLRKGLEVLCAVLATVLMAYTGLYLALMEAVPLWNNAAVPVLFVLSSLSSGAAIVLLLVPFSRDWPLLIGWIDGLHRAHRIVLGLELLALVAFLALAVANPFAVPALVQLISFGGQGAWFLAGFVLGGVVIPFGTEALRLFLGRAASVAATEVLCVFGGLILRFCLVLAGSHWLG